MQVFCRKKSKIELFTPTGREVARAAERTLPDKKNLRLTVFSASGQKAPGGDVRAARRSGRVPAALQSGWSGPGVQRSAGPCRIWWTAARSPVKALLNAHRGKQMKHPVAYPMQEKGAAAFTLFV